MELLLSLAVFAAIASVVIPQFTGLLGDRGLVRAGNQIQIRMLQLRVQAMREGRVMMMEGKADDGSIRTRPYYSMADSTETMDQSGSQSALLTGADQANAIMTTQDPEATETMEMPEGVVFQGVLVASAARALEIEQASQGMMSSGWSRPVLFFPDGTTSTARLTLTDPLTGTIDIDLRGITGDARVGEITVVKDAGGSR